MIAEVEARCPRDTAVPSVPPALCPRCSGRFKPFNPFRRPRARAHPFPPSPCPHLERLFDLEGAFPMTFRRFSAPPPTLSPPASLSPPGSVQVSAARGRDRGGAGGSRAGGTPPEPLSPRGGATSRPRPPPPGSGQLWQCGGREAGRPRRQHGAGGGRRGAGTGRAGTGRGVRAAPGSPSGGCSCRPQPTGRTVPPRLSPAGAAPR